MVRGTQKQMVVVRTNESRYYEEAYFVLRDGRSPAGESEDSMMAEANRILDESHLWPQPKKRVLRGKALFWCGFLTGSVLCAAAFLIILL